MDRHVCDFYSELFEKQHHQQIYTNSKALAKLIDAIQKQRTVLSANSEHHLSLEYLMAE